jgi:hypothetical protein
MSISETGGDLRVERRTDPMARTVTSQYGLLHRIEIHASIFGLKIGLGKASPNTTGGLV